jgi:hypothetical protein
MLLNPLLLRRDCIITAIAITTVRRVEDALFMVTWKGEGLNLDAAKS